MDGASMTRDKRNACKILVAKPETKKPHGDIGVGERLKLQWLLKEIGFEGADWIYLAQDRIR